MTTIFDDSLLTPIEIAFIESCRSCGDYDLADVRKYLQDENCGYFHGYTQIADAWHFWNDGIEYANSLKA